MWVDSYLPFLRASLVSQMVKCLPAKRETQVQSLGWEDPLEKEMATHSNTLAWKIPWTEEHGRLQFMGSWRVGHDWATHFHFSNPACHTYSFMCCGCLQVTTAALSSCNREQMAYILLSGPLQKVCWSALDCSLSTCFDPLASFCLHFLSSAVLAQSLSVQSFVW